MKNLLYLLFVLPLLFSCGGGASSEIKGCECVKLASTVQYGGDMSPIEDKLNSYEKEKYDKCWKYYKDKMIGTDVGYSSSDAAMLGIFAEKDCEK